MCHHQALNRLLTGNKDYANEGGFNGGLEPLILKPKNHNEPVILH
jgi:hypothetical protein